MLNQPPFPAAEQPIRPGLPHRDLGSDYEGHSYGNRTDAAFSTGAVGSLTIS